MERFIPVENFRKKGNTFRGKVPLNSLETALTSLETRLVSFGSFLVSRECTVSTSGEIKT